MYVSIVVMYDGHEQTSESGNCTRIFVLQTTVLVLSLCLIGFVTLLHIIGKVRVCVDRNNTHRETASDSVSE